MNMKTSRVTIAGLMIGILFLAVAITALKSSSSLWASALFTTTLVLNSTASLMAFAPRGKARNVWKGAALFGWVYLISSFGVGAIGCPPLITGELLALAEPYFIQDGMLVVGGDAPMPELTETIQYFYHNYYLQIGHSLGAMAFALIGALMAYFLTARTDQAPIR